MDWNIYEELHATIHALYAADVPLVAALSGGLWSPKVKRGSAFPYGRYAVISMVPERWNSTKNPQDAVVQFTFWVREAARTALTTTILPAFQAVFDTGGNGVAGTYATYSFETRQMHGVAVEPDDPDVFRLDVDYSVHIMPV
jgi:hypothetical protein